MTRSRLTGTLPDLLLMNGLTAVTLGLIALGVVRVSAGRLHAEIVGQSPEQFGSTLALFVMLYVAYGCLSLAIGFPWLWAQARRAKTSAPPEVSPGSEGEPTTPPNATTEPAPPTDAPVVIPPASLEVVPSVTPTEPTGPPMS